MAKINNSAVIQKLIDELELYPAKDLIPSELAEKILPVYQINSEEITVKNPVADVVASAQTAGGTGANTIYTTPATGKFYLTAYTFTSSGAVGTNDDISVIVGVVTHKLAKGGNAYLALVNPILIDPATIISLNNNSAASINGMIMGFTEA